MHDKPGKDDDKGDDGEGVARIGEEHGVYCPEVKDGGPKKKYVLIAPYPLERKKSEAHKDKESSPVNMYESRYLWQFFL